MGMPPHNVTEISREKVISLKSFGITNEEIAIHLDISHDTLQKYYRRELDTAVVNANEAMAKSLYQNGMTGDTTAQIFWLKTRGRWRTADNTALAESNDELAAELKALRERLDIQNKREY